MEDSPSNAEYTLKKSRMKYYRRLAHPNTDLQSRVIDFDHISKPTLKPMSI